MKKTKRILKWAFLFLGGIFLFPKEACAYLDPGTGSYFFQLLIAAIVGGLFGLKLFWQQIKTAIVSIFLKMTRKK